MTENTKTKAQRFESLLDNYAIATYLNDRLLDSGLLQKKIKIGNDIERMDQLTRMLVPAIANDLRTAKRKIKGLKDPSWAKGEFISSSRDIANAYFDELAANGAEWENADLEDLFIDYKQKAEDAIEEERERW